MIRTGLLLWKEETTAAVIAVKLAETSDMIYSRQAINKLKYPRKNLFNSQSKILARFYSVARSFAQKP
jgi:hypothetical protein